MKRRILLSLFVSACSLQVAVAQTFYNNGAQVGVLDGAVMIVKSGAGSNDGSLENATANGLLKNKGQITIEGSFVNSSATADGYAANTGEYIVYKDWVNNGTFNADQSTVFLRGNSQLITGSSVTTFYDLECETPSSVKTQTLDANVSNTLTLNSNELATDAYKMTVLNPDANAIIVNGVTSAFVSSTGNGRLVRYTNSTIDYLFPTGWNNGTPIIREASIAPSDASNRIYEVRMAMNNGSTTTTTSDGFSVASKGTNVEEVNDYYYHLISSNTTQPATLGLYFDPSTEDWSSIGRWEAALQWEDLLQASVANGSPRSRVLKASWTDNSRQVHALIKPKDPDKDFTFPNAFVPGATDPSVPMEDRYFSIINNKNNVVLEELMVFNRWGEMVFNSKRDGNDKWNGYFQGVLQQQGNYSYLAKVKVAATGESLPPVKGNLALIW